MDFYVEGVVVFIFVLLPELRKIRMNAKVSTIKEKNNPIVSKEGLIRLRLSSTSDLKRT